MFFRKKDPEESRFEKAYRLMIDMNLYVTRKYKGEFTLSFEPLYSNLISFMGFVSKGEIRSVGVRVDVLRAEKLGKEEVFSKLDTAVADVRDRVLLNRIQGETETADIKTL